MTVATPSSLYADLNVDAQADAPLAPRTWYGIGGKADVLITPKDLASLGMLVRRCHRDQVPLRVLGSGANLLVSDAGVDGVVLSLDSPALRVVEFNQQGNVEVVRAWCGASSEKLVQDLARRGLAGFEQMAGIPSTIGGALRMNAGGKFGAIGDAVHSVAVMMPDGNEQIFLRESLSFEYRHTNIPEGIILWAVLRLQEENPLAVRERVKEYFNYKKLSQPMSARSSGCMFKNPTLADGTRESAGKLIDLAKLKGLRVGSAFVSTEHANFICVDATDARATDVAALAEQITTRVFDAHGVTLEREVVFWGADIES
ncbi:MAG: UDP-N-acetylmuramate dehydrogenase [Phycisphaerales bacterium]|nr:UDP-N-acetylmuramate dehydrogenase [Phycisphaerales bacterium]